MARPVLGTGGSPAQGPVWKHHPHLGSWRTRSRPGLGQRHRRALGPQAWCLGPTPNPGPTDTHTRVRTGNRTSVHTSSQWDCKLEAASPTPGLGLPLYLLRRGLKGAGLCASSPSSSSARASRLSWTPHGSSPQTPAGGQSVGCRGRGLWQTQPSVCKHTQGQTGQTTRIKQPP